MTDTGRADWSAIVIRPGQWTCPVHGIITPAMDGLVPYCPHFQGGRRCMWWAHLAVQRRGKVLHAEPNPPACAGPARHLFGPGAAMVGTSPCPCTPVMMHRQWSCRAPGCGDVQEWPPHNPAVTRPR